MKLRSARRPAVIATAAVAALALGLTGTAAAKALITSNDIKDNTIQSVDVRNNSLTGSDIQTGSLQGGDLQTGAIGSAQLKDGSVGSADIATGGVGSGDIANGAVRFGDLSGSAVDQIQDGVFVGENWGVVGRNTEQGGFAELRQGPSATNFGRSEKPPLGTGSVELRTLSATSKVDFGNEVDFTGKSLVSTVGNNVGFSVFTSGAVTDVPVIRIEVDPNLSNGGGDYSTLVFQPTKNAVAGKWTNFDQGDGYFYLTGADKKDANNVPIPNTGIASLSGCGMDKQCDFAKIKTVLKDATVFSVNVGKGKDTAFFLGSVDALRLGEKVYDFEARGVFARNA